MASPDAGNGQLPSRRIGGEDLSDLALDGHFSQQAIQDLLRFLTGVARGHAPDYTHGPKPLPWPRGNFAEWRRVPLTLILIEPLCLQVPFFNILTGIQGSVWLISAIIQMPFDRPV